MVRLYVFLSRENIANK